jgi:hypothetical protein
MDSFKDAYVMLHVEPDFLLRLGRHNQRDLLLKIILVLQDRQLA